MNIKNLVKLITVASTALIASAAIGITVFKPTTTITGPDGRQITIRLQDSSNLWPSNAAAVRTMPPSTFFEVNGGALMKPKVGANGPRERDTTYVPSDVQPGSEGGLFRTLCHTSHMLFDDPIVYPGQPGKSHLHVFFGNSDVNGNTDVAGSNLANFGRSTCLGGTLNRSGYWIPALVDTRTGKPMQPFINLVYYKVDDPYYGISPERRALVNIPPPGLRMIAGKPSNAVDNYGNGDPYLWECESTANSGGPVGVSRGKGGSIPVGACVTGDDLVVVVQFPNCWDGVNLDSPSHGVGTINGTPGHMAYGNGATGCPSTHPVPLPDISFHTRYAIKNAGDLAYWRLASDNYATTIPAGRSAHGDWINGWDQTVLARIRDNCWRPNKDCSVGFLDGGRELY